MKPFIAACAALASSLTISLGAHAQSSSVTLGGTVDTFVGSMRNAGDPVRVKILGSGGMTTSYFGVFGVEDLGGGLTAVFNLNAFFRGDSGSIGRFDGDPFFARDANVGLKGGLGSVIVGRAKAPNFLPTVFVTPFGDSFTFSPVILHADINTAKWPYASTPSDTGWSNQVTYSTPNFGGLTANLQYQFGEQTSAGNTSKHNLGGNLIYFGGPWVLTAFYERDQITNPFPSLITTTVAGVVTPTIRKDWMVGGSYDFNFLKLFASYGQSKREVTNYDAKTSSFGAQVPIGVGFVLFDAAYTKLASPLNLKRATATLGYDYFMTKRTDLYAMAVYDKVTAQANATSVALGIRHRF
ncbi:MAG TPA: porin [Burkholderiaceae bacterium]|nr:porin [Burkholderiaceae bacterium]